jgi:hypothetical protein
MPNFRDCKFICCVINKECCGCCIMCCVGCALDLRLCSVVQFGWSKNCGGRSGVSLAGHQPNRSKQQKSRLAAALEKSKD